MTPDEEREVRTLLERLDHPQPQVRVADVIARARRPASSPARRAAAGFLATLALAGAAYALPGSPVRDWFSAAGRRQAHRPPVAAPASASPDSAPGAGIAVEPGPDLVILFRGPAGGAVRISIGEGGNVELRAPAGAATFTAEVGRIAVEHAAPTTFDVVLPRGASRIEIRAGERRLLLMEGGRFTGRSSDSAGPYVVQLPLPNS